MFQWVASLRKRIIGFSFFSAFILLAYFFSLRFFENFVKEQVHEATGFKVSIGRSSIDFPNHQLRIERLKINNPEEYPEKLLADIPLITIQVAPHELIRERRILVTKMYLELEELRIVKARSGSTNISRLKTMLPKEGSAGRASIPWTIEELILTIKRVQHIEFHASGEVTRKEYYLGIEKQKFQNIKDADGIMKLIMEKLFYDSILGKLNFGIDFKSVFQNLEQSVGKGVQKAKRVISEISGTGIETASSTVPASQIKQSGAQSSKPVSSGKASVVIGEVQR